MKLRAGLQIAALSLLAIQLLTLARAVPPDGAGGQHFVCDAGFSGYSLDKCHADVAVLRKTLAKYPAAELGEWTWVLVRSADWKRITLRHGLDSDSPAFTYVPKRETFVEEALVASVPEREWELDARWRMNTDQLLDLAVAHELAHVLCNEPGEARTNRLAKMLLDGKPLPCEATLSANTRPEKIDRPQ